MTRTRRWSCVAIVVTVTLSLSGCQWRGLNSLPLPGATGRVPGAAVYYIDISDVGSLDSNSPVKLNDVTVGSVGDMSVHNWHARVTVFIEPGITVPANATATVGQTSLLGSSHIALDPPVGAVPTGQLPARSTIPLSRSTTAPTTEQTLAALSVVVNGGGLGQIGDIVKQFNNALNGREGAIRDLLTRLDTFVGVFAAQRADVIATMEQLNALTATIAGQRDTITRALAELPPALDILVREEPRLTAALDKLHVFSDTATGVISDVKTDLVANLRHLEPTVRALADVGEDIDTAIAAATTFPQNQYFIDHAVKGDYVNLAGAFDFTLPRLKHDLLAGTRWGDIGVALQAALGDPGYAEQNPGTPPAADPTNLAQSPPAVPGGR
ncbi:virulence factor Mce-like protein [Mycolicibacterium sp. BK634]|uniref:MCE family protein n=1 Tax=Mycolicibacterium sp. BK634 TaxID=2587099 RepID=UPI001610F155|nr:MCE family protein [Mycolicibacterium sp. BK634]MBB3753833.1 virulence factor Mce-like protein [Mycolicibacterium sp. BK634]